VIKRAWMDWLGFSCVAVHSLTLDKSVKKEPGVSAVYEIVE
jgi:hypothetical protein